MENRRLAVPGAELYVEVHGTGPLLLLIPGGASDAEVFQPLAAALAADYRVVSYDPRGISRSGLHGPPPEPWLAVHTDDAYRLLDHVAEAGESAAVFGSCSGGLIALELAIRHPDRVRPAVVHEPPALGLLPDAEQQLAFVDEVHEVFRRDGVPAALRMLSALFGGRPAPVLPEAHDNSAFFLAHVLRPSARCVPGLSGLVGAADQVVVAGGHDSRRDLIHRPAVVLAKRLGRAPVLFPGGHAGYAKYPVAFGRQLAKVLRTLPVTGQEAASCAW
ncbi:alpha/beta fold hydrolase [Streptomyces sp. NPDC052396]|uniref:alpha/beta fold hydrolase n=1 Tax=Streptomyces sp. NPDC052396 TaxID=3365689 RepID=UPI0037D6A76E